MEWGEAPSTQPALSVQALHARAKAASTAAWEEQKRKETAEAVVEALAKKELEHKLELAALRTAAAEEKVKLLEGSLQLQSTDAQTMHLMGKQMAQVALGYVHRDHPVFSQFSPASGQQPAGGNK